MGNGENMYQPINLEKAVGETAHRREERIRRNLEEKRQFIEQAFDGLTAEKAAEIAKTLPQKLPDDMLPLLYDKCIMHYDEKNYIPIFGELKTNRRFLDAVKAKYGCNAEPLFDAMEKGGAREYVNNYAGVSGEGKSGYLEALKTFGIDEESRLYKACVQIYIVVCNAAEYKALGVGKIKELTADFDDNLERRLLKNMLRKLDAYQLRAYVSMIERFSLLTGDRGSDEFTVATNELTQQEIAKYCTWVSQYKILQTLGNGPVADFWYGFADKAEIIVHGPTKTLILDFGKFVVLELVSGEAAYFYDKEYYYDKVSAGFSLSGTEAELEKWLHDNTEWAAQGEHLNHWRKAHKGNWQLDMKEYINKYQQA